MKPNREYRKIYDIEKEKYVKFKPKYILKLNKFYKNADKDYYKKLFQSIEDMDQYTEQEK